MPLRLLISSAVALTFACGPTSSTPAKSTATTPTPTDSPATTTEPTGSEEPLPMTCTAEEGGESFGAMKNEVVGGVHIGDAAAEVTSKLGAPTSVEGPLPNVIAGGELWNWHYDGVTVELASETTAEAAIVSSMTIKAGSVVKTRFGVGVGSTESDVRQAYDKCIDSELSTGDLILVGSEYGGVFFTIKDGLVSGIFVGAGAE